jgi:hypothetical protein
VPWPLSSYRGISDPTALINCLFGHGRQMRDAGSNELPQISEYSMYVVNLHQWKS